MLLDMEEGSSALADLTVGLGRLVKATHLEQAFPSWLGTLASTEHDGAQETQFTQHFLEVFNNMGL